MDMTGMLTRFDGRIGRLGFWAGALVTGLATGLLMMAAQWLTRPTDGPQVATAAVLLAMCWPLSAVFAKRLHDRGRPGAPWIVILLAPNILRRFVELGFAAGLATGTANWLLIGASAVTSVWTLVDLGLMPGTPGANAYGPAPL